jgi:hypothetical protein
MLCRRMYTFLEDSGYNYWTNKLLMKRMDRNKFPQILIKVGHTQKNPVQTI